MIKNDKITVSIVGDVNVENTVAIINKHLPFENRSKKIDLFEQNNKEITTVKEEIIVQDVQQAKLAMGYRFDVRYLDDDYYPAIVFNSLLGSSSDSLLHMRIREELGLVYFINSSYDFYKGVLFIFSGIDASKYEIVQEEIVKIITNIELGKIDLKFLEIAKLSLINSIIESHDSIGTQAVRLERQDFFNNEITKEKSIEFIQAVTLEDIKKVASKVSLDTKVLLRGENNE